MSKSPIHNTPAKILGLSSGELEKIKDQFPYFNSARMLLLKKHQGTGESSERELSSSAVWSSDRKKMNDFLKKRARSEYPPIVAQEDTKAKEKEPESIEETIIEEQPIAVPEQIHVTIDDEQPIDIHVPSLPEPQKEEQISSTEIETPEESLPDEQKKQSDMEATPDKQDEEQPVSVVEMQPDAEIAIAPENNTIEETDIDEEGAEDAEESRDPPPETRKFIVADHTFDEWLDHFKKGKHSVKQLLQDKPKAAEEAADELNRLIESSMPATFFHDKLETETQYAKGLENFIDTQKKKKAGISRPAETGLVTETLAKIYERQGLVDKAIHVYEQLILKNPEKSAYFAVQIERLKNK